MIKFRLSIKSGMVHKYHAPFLYLDLTLKNNSIVCNIHQLRPLRCGDSSIAFSVSSIRSSNVVTIYECVLSTIIVVVLPYESRKQAAGIPYLQERNIYTGSLMDFAKTDIKREQSRRLRNYNKI